MFSRERPRRERHVHGARRTEPALVEHDGVHRPRAPDGYVQRTRQVRTGARCAHAAERQVRRVKTRFGGEAERGGAPVDAGCDLRQCIPAVAEAEPHDARAPRRGKCAHRSERHPRRSVLRRLRREHRLQRGQARGLDAAEKLERDVGGGGIAPPDVHAIPPAAEPPLHRAHPSRQRVRKGHGDEAAHQRRRKNRLSGTSSPRTERRTQSSATWEARSFTQSRVPQSWYRWVTTLPARASPKHTVPTGLSGVPPLGPAIPVTATPRSAERASRTPAAISPAVFSETAPCAASVSVRTPRSWRFTSSAYATMPPRSHAELPGTSVSRCPRSPPVHDSATASVVPPAARSRPTVSCMVTEPSPYAYDPSVRRSFSATTSRRARASSGGPCTTTRSDTSGKLARNDTLPSSGPTTPATSSSRPDSVMPKVWNVCARYTSPPRWERIHGRTVSSNIGFISRGTPGSTTRWTSPTARRYPGAVPSAFGTTAAPAGIIACRRLFGGMARPAAAKKREMRSADSACRTSDTPATRATVSLVRSSAVGPMPPVDTTRSARPMAWRQAHSSRSG